MDQLIDIYDNNLTSTNISISNREQKHINRTNTYDICDKRAAKRSLSIDKHYKVYRNKKYDRMYKYSLLIDTTN